MSEVSEIKKFDVENREFFLNKEITSKNIEAIIVGINTINREDDENQKNKIKFERKPIKLTIDSCGGTIYDGMGLLNLIEVSRTPVHTYCYSKAMSMALSIFAAGHKRYAHKRATFMHHQLSGDSYGTFTDILEDIEQKKVIQSMMDELLVEQTKIKMEEILKYRERKLDWYFNGSEAFDLGLVDVII